jgi:hypothetical protein
VLYTTFFYLKGTCGDSFPFNTPWIQCWEELPTDVMLH